LTSSDAAALFLYTAHLAALVNARDQWHAVARRWEQRLQRDRRKLVTTELVLYELANALATLRYRGHAVTTIHAIQRSPVIEVVPASPELWSAAFELYQRHDDKEWGLTDCASFVVTRERGIWSALTSDEHFIQAGFRALLREDC